MGNLYHTLSGRAAGRNSRLITILFIFTIFVFLTGMIPIRSVFAASQEVNIPYRQEWTNKSGESVSNSFEYRLTPADGEPLPDEASGGYYSFVLKGKASGNLNLHFPFTAPGYYNYHVKAHIPDRKKYYSYDEETYDVMIMMINSVDGLEIGAMTIQDESLDKYPELPFSVAYTKKPDDTEEKDPEEDDPGRGNISPPARNGGNDNRAGDGTATPGPGTVPAATASTVIGNPEPPTTMPDPEPPTTITDPEPPTTISPEPGEDYWALLNLILMVLTVLMAIADGILYYRRPKSDKEAEDRGEVPEDEEWQERYDRHGVIRILALIVAIISFILFFLTEDMRLPMEWIDEYTIWMVILFVAEIILAVLSRKRELEADPGDDTGGTGG